MGFMHHTVKMHGRSNRAGRRSACQVAAYVCGDAFECPRFRQAYDHRRKDDVVCVYTQLPANAPTAWREPQQVARAIEAAEIRDDAQLLREIEVQLPSEMARWTGQEWRIRNEGLRVIEQHSERLAEYGMATIVGVHLNVSRRADPETGRTIEIPRPGAHLLTATREVREEGVFGSKRRDWNDRSLYHHLRAVWEDRVNEALSELGSDRRVTRHSYAAHGIPLTGCPKLGRAPAEPAGPAPRPFVVLDETGTPQEIHAWRRPAVMADVLHDNAEVLRHRPAVAVQAARLKKRDGAAVTRDEVKAVVVAHTPDIDTFHAVMAGVDRHLEETARPSGQETARGPICRIIPDASEAPDGEPGAPENVAGGRGYLQRRRRAIDVYDACETAELTAALHMAAARRWDDGVQIVLDDPTLDRAELARCAGEAARTLGWRSVDLGADGRTTYIRGASATAEVEGGPHADLQAVGAGETGSGMQGPARRPAKAASPSASPSRTQASDRGDSERSAGEEVVDEPVSSPETIGSAAGQDAPVVWLRRGDTLEPVVRLAQDTLAGLPAGFADWGDTFAVDQAPTAETLVQALEVADARGWSSVVIDCDENVVDVVDLAGVVETVRTILDARGMEITVEDAPAPGSGPSP